MLKKTLIGSTTSAAKALLIVENWNLNGSIFLFGSGLASIAETVTIEIATVENPDVSNDAHWATFVYDSDSYVLNSANHGQGIPLRGTYRINKPVSSTAFGIRYE